MRSLALQECREIGAREDGASNGYSLHQRAGQRDPVRYYSLLWLIADVTSICFVRRSPIDASVAGQIQFLTKMRD
jgi:hypothetical protein